MNQTLNPLTISFFFGIGIVLFCISAYIFPYGNKFRDKVQTIKGFGVDLQVSVLTVFILMGFVLTFSAVFLQLKGYQDQLKKLEDERTQKSAAIEHMQKQLEQMRKLEVRALVTLEGLDLKSYTQLSPFECKYLLPGQERAFKADVSEGFLNEGAEPTIEITLRDITAETHVKRLTVQDKDHRYKWVLENFEPLQPNYRLKKAE